MWKVRRQSLRLQASLLTVISVYQDAIEAYDIKKTAIPTREYKQVQNGKWYG